jgi:hypothetical protein
LSGQGFPPATTSELTLAVKVKNDVFALFGSATTKVTSIRPPPKVVDLLSRIYSLKM